jgi:integrase/recombinase XerC
MRQTFSALPLTDWPEMDRVRWNDAQKPTRLFGPPRPASKWRPATRLATEQYYGLFLWWLHATEGLDPTARPIDRATEDRVHAFIKAYSDGRAESTVAMAVRGVAFLVRATEPPDGLPWLSQLAYRLANTAKPARLKLPRLVPIPALIELGKQLMDTGRAKLVKGQVGGAQVFRDGLMIAALATRPLRSSNLAGLQIGKSIWQDARGVHVQLQGEETKVGREIEFSFPTWLAPAFETYLKEARPILLRRAAEDDEDHLWIGRRARVMTTMEIFQRMTILTRRHLGRSVSPHLFRDCAATDIAIFDPGHIGIVKTVLSHADHATGEKYYNLATMLSASAKHQSVIARLRSRGTRR